MSGEHDDEPTHQAFWVFFLTVGSLYAILMFILTVQYVAGRITIDQIPYAMGVQGVLFGGFLVLFGGFFALIKKFLSDPETKASR